MLVRAPNGGEAQVQRAGGAIVTGWRADAFFFGHGVMPCLRVRSIDWLSIPRMNPPDDATLLAAVARRDETAFAELYDRFAQPVFSLVVRVVRSRAEAEEILQEAFWQVWEHAPNFRAELGSAFGWVVTIARRKAIDRLRSNLRHLQRIEEAKAHREDDEFEAPAGPQALAADERGLAVRAALARLGREERRAIVLAFFDGLTHEEIAAALSAPVGTIKARIRRGMLKLKPALERARQTEAL
jgi:RNA polymerase sigma-70 factor (ECF subfamily)